MGKTLHVRGIPDEFRHQALELLKSSGKSTKQIKEDLGITLGLLGKWRLRYQVVSKGAAGASLEPSDIEAKSTLLYYWPMDEAAGATSLAATRGGTAINITVETFGASGQIDGTFVSFNGTSNFDATSSSIDLSAYDKVVVGALVYINSYDTAYRTVWAFSANPIGLTTGFLYWYSGGGNCSSSNSNVFLTGNNGSTDAINSPFLAASEKLMCWEACPCFPYMVIF
jgi:hypothetical protein